MGLLSGSTGLLASSAHLWMGLEQEGGSGSQLCPSPTSELEESPLGSDSSSELQGKVRWKRHFRGHSSSSVGVSEEELSGSQSSFSLFHPLLLPFVGAPQLSYAHSHQTLGLHPQHHVQQLESRRC